MNAWNIALHDAEVVAVENRRESRVLILRLKMPDGTNASLEFLDVEGWELSPFREQNVLMDVYIWTASDERTRARCKDIELPQTWEEAIMHGRYNLYEIDASVGLGGYVVARNTEVSTQ